MTLGSFSISLRASSPRTRGGLSDSGSRCGRPMPRNAFFGVTIMVSKRPLCERRFAASCCRPTPRESIATSEATPTATPSVVRVLRRMDSRRLRRARSEERRVGKECRSRWSPYHEKKNKAETVLDEGGLALRVGLVQTLAGAGGGENSGRARAVRCSRVFFFKQKTAYEVTR